MFFRRRNRSDHNVTLNSDGTMGPVTIKVVGVGGGGGNAVLRMAGGGARGVKFLALNTDVQALSNFKGVPTFAIGPDTTHGLGAGGRPEVGRKAIRESQEQVTQLLNGAEMVFVTAGMGGGTGTGAAGMVAELARKMGALTVGVVTLPFSFEGPQRREIAESGLQRLQAKVDTLIIVDNDMLLPASGADIKLTQAFDLADKVLQQGVQGISDIITLPGLINVDFADVKSVMHGGGLAFMALGEGKGREAAAEAAESALSNPLFGHPLKGARGILFNVTGGPDLTLQQVHEVAECVKQAADDSTNTIFGVVQNPRMKKRIRVTLVATGVDGSETAKTPSAAGNVAEPVKFPPETGNGNSAQNGHATTSLAPMKPLF